eukprot:TRINITY_DN85_c0_g1_i2.p2 TRINITY_DN85_c0_g1~~TRINITY_DN85_c0_g1_i2.p2  ORF type:complete len:189 (-),score=25.61 TRINITY_DN85_c0_g1_i2:25-591(-)
MRRYRRTSRSRSRSIPKPSWSKKSSLSRSPSPLLEGNSVCVTNLIPGLTQSQLSRSIFSALNLSELEDQEEQVSISINESDHSALVSFKSSEIAQKCLELGQLDFFGILSEIKLPTSLPRREHRDCIYYKFPNPNQAIKSILKDNPKLERFAGLKINQCNIFCEFKATRSESKAFRETLVDILNSQFM